jgi:hypothetical protein
LLMVAVKRVEAFAHFGLEACDLLAQGLMASRCASILTSHCIKPFWTQPRSWRSDRWCWCHAVAADHRADDLGLCPSQLSSRSR